MNIAESTIHKICQLEDGWISAGQDDVIILVEKDDMTVEFSVYQKAAPKEKTSPLAFVTSCMFAYRGQAWELSPGDILQRFFKTLDRKEHMEGTR